MIMKRSLAPENRCSVRSACASQAWQAAKVLWVVFAVVAWVGCGVLCVMSAAVVRQYRVEDRIHRAYGPIVCAIYSYQSKKGCLPQALVDLRPDYIADLPHTAYVDTVQYRVLDGGGNWELALHSSALPRSRIYLHRSSRQYSQEEEEHTVLQYHGMWRVIE